MKLFSLVAPNFQQGPRHLNAYYLPYSAGVLAAAALANPLVTEKFQLDSIIWKRENIEQTAQLLAQNDLVGFSCYVWNYQYQLKLSQRLRELNAKCKIVFGGPEVAHTDPNIFFKIPWVDALVVNEGEQVFSELLLSDQDSWTNIQGLVVNQDQQALITGQSERIRNLDQLPSPYLTGIFDRIVKDNPEVTWNAVIETNRGCPYQCTFCDWGSLTYSKISKFDLSRIYQELDWISRHCDLIDFADANFGIFPERDTAIVDRLLSLVERKENRLNIFSMTWAKNQRREVINIVKKISKARQGFNNGLSLSVQSLDTTVLDNIRRRNLQSNQIEQIFELCEKEQIPVATEFILGLPGETAESWKENFWQIFRLGNHTGISVYQAQVLANAELNLIQRRLYKIETVPSCDYIQGSHTDHDCKESVDIVVSTSTINRETMVDILVWNTFIQAFHIDGLSNFIARFLYKSKGIDYSQFYDLLYDYVNKDTWFVQEFAKTREIAKILLDKGEINSVLVGSFCLNGLNFIHRLTMIIRLKQQVDYTLALVKNYVNDNYSLEKGLAEDLFSIQKNSIITFVGLDLYPLQQTYQYDVIGYLQGQDLNTAHIYNFEQPEQRSMTEQMFYEYLYYGKKRNFGKARITKTKHQLTFNENVIDLAIYPNKCSTFR